MYLYFHLYISRDVSFERRKEGRKDVVVIGVIPVGVCVREGRKVVGDVCWMSFLIPDLQDIVLLEVHLLRRCCYHHPVGAPTESLCGGTRIRL